jgi:hypothetical protein
MTSDDKQNVDRKYACCQLSKVQVIYAFLVFILRKWSKIVQQWLRCFLTKGVYKGDS